MLAGLASHSRRSLATLAAVGALLCLPGRSHADWLIQTLTPDSSSQSRSVLPQGRSPALTSYQPQETQTSWGEETSPTPPDNSAVRTIQALVTILVMPPSLFTMQQVTPDGTSSDTVHGHVDPLPGVTQSPKVTQSGGGNTGGTSPPPPATQLAPEPASLITGILGSACAGLAALYRRRRK